MIMEIIENTMYFLPATSTLFIQPAEKYNPTNATDSPITAEKPEPYRITNRAIIIIFVDTTNCKTKMHKKPINKPRLNTNGVTERIFPSHNSSFLFWDYLISLYQNQQNNRNKYCHKKYDHSYI